jgi:transglutaminase-like putative cysteine protease
VGVVAVLTVRDRQGSADRSGSTPKSPARGPRPAAAQYLSRANAGATIALTLLTVAAAGGFDRVFAGHSWIGPVMLTAVAVHAVCWLSRKLRAPRAVAASAAALTIFLMAVWTILGPTTHYGFPGVHSWDAFVAGLRQANHDFSASTAPVTATAGFRIAAALGAGIAAAGGDWLAFRVKSALLACLPAFALFVVCSTTGAGSGRIRSVVTLLAALLVFLVAHRASGAGGGQVWFAGTRAGVASWALRSSAAMAGAALLISMLALPFLPKNDGVGLFGWRGSGPGGSGERTVANPVVDLQTRLLSQSTTPVFTVQSPVSSYWRLTSLETFNGVTWTSNGSYSGFGSKLKGTSAIPIGTRTVQEHFHIQQLGSPWLPDAFTPVSVKGVKGVSYDPTTGSLITSKTTSDGFDYNVTSYQYLSTLDPAKLEAAPPVGHSSFVNTYLQLPDTVSPQVTALAQQIVAGKSSEYDKALAIQDYFHSPIFKYSLDPPVDGTGNQALAGFLFVTHSGYCQQYAGAYAVLARAAGLPTRLAVGFATGTSLGGGNYQVRNEDAHTWPEVWFGSQLGWLPFEPTPAFTDPSAVGYTGTGSSAANGGNGNSVHPVTPKPGAKTPVSNPSGGSAASTIPNFSTGSHAKGSGFGWLLGLLGALAVAAAWIALNSSARRARWALRRRRARRVGPAGEVLSYWSDVSELLAWWGVARRPDETDDEFARRAGIRLSARISEPAPSLTSGVSRLAGLAQEASFAPVVPGDRPAEAAIVASEIHKKLIRAARATQLLAWAFVPLQRGEAPAR